MREMLDRILDKLTIFCFSYLPYIVILGTALYFFTK